MQARRIARFALATVLFSCGVLVGSLWQPWSVMHAQGGRKVYEIRTYTAMDGRLDALNARFRNHTMRIFDKHNMKSVGYWTPQDAPQSQNTLIYILAHPSRDAAKQNWDAFRNDPEWKKVSAESEKDGRIVSKVESVFVEPTDYSPMK